jgi:hypothetical protein
LPGFIAPSGLDPEAAKPPKDETTKKRPAMSQTW